MNNKIYILFFILLWFILNIFFYLLSDNYRYFLQSLKSNNTKYSVNDKFKIDVDSLVKENKIKEDESIFSWLAKDFSEENKKVNKKKTKIKNTENQASLDNKEEEIKNNKIEEKQVEFIQDKSIFAITKIEEEVLNKFKKYNLKKVEFHNRLFGLTSEYPDKYEEYYNQNFTLYLFWNKHYDELKDIFKVLTYELPISLNEVNNFWKKSFYINLNELFTDNYVRIILEYKNRTFWLKIKKDYYNKIKNNLAQIFKK